MDFFDDHGTNAMPHTGVNDKLKLERKHKATALKAAEVYQNKTGQITTMEDLILQRNKLTETN